MAVTERTTAVRRPPRRTQAGSGPWLAVLVPAQVALSGVPEAVAFERAHQLGAFLAWVPDLLVAERYPAAGRGFPGARRGTSSP